MFITCIVGPVRSRHSRCGSSMRACTYLQSLLLALALGACEGGQTGTPDSNHGFPSVDAGCGREPADADAETPFGSPPSALLAAFTGAHQLRAYWVEYSPADPGSPPQPFGTGSFED